MPDPTPLQAALQVACNVALAHNVDSRIEPASFGVQTSPAGTTHATYVDVDHAVTVWLDRNGRVAVRVAELTWTHWSDPDETDDEVGADYHCEVCHPDDSAPTHYRGALLTDVYLPGDAPKAVANA